MNNRINEIRRKISSLRSEMADVEASVRDQVNRGLDCAVGARQLMSLRQDLKLLIGEWRAAGGGDRLPDVGGARPIKKGNKLGRMPLVGGKLEKPAVKEGRSVCQTSVRQTSVRQVTAQVMTQVAARHPF
jgi:hypothetical protein